MDWFWTVHIGMGIEVKRLNYLLMQLLLWDFPRATLYKADMSACCRIAWRSLKCCCVLPSRNGLIHLYLAFRCNKSIFYKNSSLNHLCCYSVLIFTKKNAENLYDFFTITDYTHVQWNSGFQAWSNYAPWIIRLSPMTTVIIFFY